MTTKNNDKPVDVNEADNHKVKSIDLLGKGELTEWPEPKCMECGSICETTEELFTPERELWCWCNKCEIDTFHPIKTLS